MIPFMSGLSWLAAFMIVDTIWFKVDKFIVGMIAIPKDELLFFVVESLMSCSMM